MFIKVGNIYFATKKAKEGASDFHCLKGCHVRVGFRCMTSEHRSEMNE